MKHLVTGRTTRLAMNLRHSFIVGVLICFWVLIVPISPSHAQQRVVATVGEDGQVTIGDLNQYLQERLDILYSQPRRDALYTALDHVVGQRLKQIDFFNRGYQTNTSFRESVERSLTEELVLAYGRDRYENRYLNEDRIREEHQLMGRRVQYSELTVQKSESFSAEQLRRLRQEIATAVEQIQEGVSIQDAEQYLRNQVPGAVINRREGRLTWEETVESPRALLILRTPVNEVRSFETTTALSIVRIDGYDPRQSKSLEEAREEIVDALHGWYAQAATSAFREEWMSVIDEKSLEWNDRSVDQIIAWLNTPGFIGGGYRTTIRQHVQQNGDGTIVTDGMTSLRLSDLPRIFDRVLIPSEGGRYNQEVVREFVLEAIRTEEIASRAREIGLERDVLSPHTSSRPLALAMVRFYNEKHITPRIPDPTSARLTEFYEKHVDSLFYQLRGANIHIIERNTADEIDAVWNEIQRGVRFESASSRRLNRVYRRTHEGAIVSNLRSEPAYFADIAFDLEEGEIAGPLAFQTAEGETRYAIIKGVAQYEDRRLRFDEVVDRVREEYLKQERERVEAEVRSELEEKYGVNVHSDVLDSFINRRS